MEGPVFAGTIFPFAFIHNRSPPPGAVSGFHSLDFKWPHSRRMPPANREPAWSVRGHDGRVDGRGFGHDRGVGVATGVVFRGQQPGWHRGPGRPKRPRTTHQFLGIPGHRRPEASLAHAAASRRSTTATGGAPALRMGMAQIFQHSWRTGGMALWYHSPLMFEELFHPYHHEAGTRVGRSCCRTR